MNQGLVHVESVLYTESQPSPTLYHNGSNRHQYSTLPTKLEHMQGNG
jgi:hypothetical protein